MDALTKSSRPPTARIFSPDRLPAWKHYLHSLREPQSVAEAREAFTSPRRILTPDPPFRMEQLALCVGVGLGGVLCREPIGRAPLTHLPARMCSLLCCTAIWTLCVSWTFLGIFVARCSAFVRLLDSCSFLFPPARVFPHRDCSVG